MKRTALDGPRRNGADLTGEEEKEPQKTEFWLEWLGCETRIPCNWWNRKNAHGDPTCSLERTAIRMPETNIHFHQSGFEDRL